MKYLIAMLIDEEELVDDEDQPLVGPRAVLEFLVAEFGADEDGHRPVFGVLGPGPSGMAAERAFEQLPGLVG